MKPELLPYIAAFIAVLVFCIARQAFRNFLGLHTANVLGAAAAGLVYCGFYLHRDASATSIRIPDWALPVALLLILFLLASAAFVRRRLQATIQRPSASGSQLPRQAEDSRSDEYPTATRPGRARSDPRYRQQYPAGRYSDRAEMPRQPRGANPDDLYPDEEQFRER